MEITEQNDFVVYKTLTKLTASRIVILSEWTSNKC